MLTAAKIAPMSERYERPAWVRRINAMADSVGGAIEGAKQLLPIDADELLEAATQSLGGGSFGDFGDSAWQKRFADLVSAIDASRLNLVGRLITKQELLRALRTRLLLSRAVERESSILDEKIRAPVFVTGPARSGTTILFELLWLDPALRGPLAWEALHPLPLPEAADADVRPLVSECEQELWADVQPEFAAVHELRSDLPVECVTLTTPCFCGPHWGMVLEAPPPLDVSLFYDFHRRILQVLQHGRPEQTWLLKTPQHLTSLGPLFETYPDAWVVQTHRDPTRTMPSTVSTTALIRWLRTDHIDVAALATVIEAAFGWILNSVAEQRATHALPERFVDVHFQDLMKDPVRTLEATYSTMGREFTREHAKRVRTYLDEKPRGKFGVHRYTAEEWGFDAAALRERMEPYIRHFGVALES
jgi:hypothetical protein